MRGEARRARDPDLLDAVDAYDRLPFEAEVWRVAREGRDPALGGPSRSRWCNGTFDVLYTSLERDGAVAEIHALLSLQPVFPSKDRSVAHRLKVSALHTLKLADLPALAALGVDVARYTGRDYGRTQEIADAALFLGFDALLVPSARWPCQNLILFTERVSPERIEVTGTTATPIDWKAWQARTRR